MPANTAPSKRPPASGRPRWARAVTLFAGQAFDVGSTREYAAAAAEYATLSEGERDYYRDHLLFRQVQALEGIHDALGVLVGHSDRAGRTMAVGFRGALELLQDIAGEGDEVDDDGPSGPGGDDIAGDGATSDDGLDDVDEEPPDGDGADGDGAEGDPQAEDEPDVSILDAEGEELAS